MVASSSGLTTHQTFFFSKKFGKEIRKDQESIRRSRNFRQGGGGGGGGRPGQSDKKSSDNVGFFLVLSLFYRSQMVNFKEMYHFVVVVVDLFMAL